MRIRICAIGRATAGAEFDLVQDYLARFNRQAQNIGLGPCELITQEAKKSDMQSEAILIKKQLSPNARLMVLDERGKQLSSPGFAAQLARWRDDDNRDLVIVIGGADGVDPSVRAQADFTLSFGPMVWPHMLVRVMLAEQLYRAASILAGGPYHRV